MWVMKKQLRRPRGRWKYSKKTDVNDEVVSGDCEWNYFRVVVGDEFWEMDETDGRA
jgi:hypothetical protein